jgi:hypothetical protein
VSCDFLFFRLRLKTILSTISTFTADVSHTFCTEQRTLIRGDDDLTHWVIVIPASLNRPLSSPSCSLWLLYGDILVEPDELFDNSIFLERLTIVLLIVVRIIVLICVACSPKIDTKRKKHEVKTVFTSYLLFFFVSQAWEDRLSFIFSFRPGIC